MRELPKWFKARKAPPWERVIPLAGTRARSRNNGNRLNKYLPSPPSAASTLFQVDYPLFPAEKSRHRGSTMH